MQIIRPVAVSPEQYANEDLQQTIKPPTRCPHCGAQEALMALGYYSRHLTSVERSVLRIFVRRFRCCICQKTVSILPSFAQPYRLVLNVTINEFFNGTVSAHGLKWLSLLKQYWNRFKKWLPAVESTIASLVERSPPSSDPIGWWQIIVQEFGNLESITTTLVSRLPPLDDTLAEHQSHPCIHIHTSLTQANLGTGLCSHSRSCGCPSSTGSRSGSTG